MAENQNQSETRGAKKKLFGNLIKALIPRELQANYSYHTDEYHRIVVWYGRLRSRLYSYIEYYYPGTRPQQADTLLSYLLAIYIDTTSIHDKEEKISQQNTFKNNDYSLFINRCLTYNFSPKNKKTKTAPKRGHYSKTTCSEWMSSFLCFFEENSKITTCLKPILTSEQRNKLNKLIHNNKLPHEKLFLKLIGILLTEVPNTPL